MHQASVKTLEQQHISASSLGRSPLPAHVQQEDVQARLLLLHQLQDALHTQTVGRPVRQRRVHRHHEAVAVVFIAVTGVVQQT